MILIREIPSGRPLRFSDGFYENLKIYYSYSTKVNSKGEDLNRTLRFAEKSVDLTKKFYKNVNLITDTKGVNIFKNIGFKNVYNILDIVPEKYKDVWSLGKLYSIRYISSLKQHFAHMDFDFFITKRLSNDIEKSEIFVQSIEHNLRILKYGIPIFEKKCKRKYSNEKSNIAYNCGIIGGKNYEFFNEYASKAIEMVEDPENANLWVDEVKELAHWSKATLAEQYFFACLLREKNIIPSLVFDNTYSINYAPSDLKYFKNTGAFHLYGSHKSNDFFLDLLDLKEKPVVDDEL